MALTIRRLRAGCSLPEEEADTSEIRAGDDVAQRKKLETPTPASGESEEAKVCERSESSTPISSSLDQILGLAKMGLHLFSLVPLSKLPLHGLRWKKRATNDVYQLRQWFRKHPGCHWAAATGQVSGFFALDVDGSSGAESPPSLVEQIGALPETMMVASGSPNRFHLYSSVSTEVRNSQSSLGPDLDIRGRETTS